MELSSCAYLPLQEFINLQLLKANFIYIILSMQIRILIWHIYLIKFVLKTS